MLTTACAPGSGPRWGTGKKRASVLTVCVAATWISGATAVFFLTLAGKDLQVFSLPEKVLLAVALLLFGLTTVLCLYGLHVDARRFFHIAKQLEADENDRSWVENLRYRKLRLRLIYGSYLSASAATGAVVAFLILRL